MNVLLWILQVVLAIVSAFHGWLFTTWTDQTQAVMLTRQPGMQPLNLPHTFVLFIGLAELAAAVGLILPGWLKIAPRLTSLASAGLAVILAGATVYHVQRSEPGPALSTALIALIAVFVAFMRWRRVRL
jgi:hypothetical protein